MGLWRWNFWFCPYAVRFKFYIRLICTAVFLFCWYVVGYRLFLNICRYANEFVFFFHRYIVRLRHKFFPNFCRHADVSRIPCSGSPVITIFNIVDEAKGMEVIFPHGRRKFSCLAFPHALPFCYPFHDRIENTNYQIVSITLTKLHGKHFPFHARTIQDFQ